MRESSKAQERDSRIWTLDKSHHRDTGHQDRAGSERAAPRVDERNASLLQRGGNYAAEDASKIGGEKWQPRRQRNVLQVHVPHFAEIQRKPKRKRAPCG